MAPDDDYRQYTRRRRRRRRRRWWRVAAVAAGRLGHTPGPQRPHRFSRLRTAVAITTIVVDLFYNDNEKQCRK